MRQRYFDSAATTRPKAPGVSEAAADFLDRVCCNIGRGDYQSAYDAENVALEVREKLCALLGGPAPQNVIFTPGCTHSLNYVVKGLLEPGDRAAVSTMEHNAVLRPLKQMERWGVAVDYLPCSRQGELLLEQVEGCLTERTRLVVLTHASNVCGTRMPIEAVGKLSGASSSVWTPPRAPGCSPSIWTPCVSTRWPSLPIRG